MRNITIKNIAFTLFILIALSACSEKGKGTTTEKVKPDSTAVAKIDSAEAAEARETKEVLDVVKK